jgi:M6 family metalloprotease-like protein
MPVPFSGEQFTFYNPDGSEIRVLGWGNQFEAVFETLEGYTVVKDPESGFYEYAMLSSDRESLVPSGTRVGVAEPESLGLPQHVRAPRATTRANAELAHDEGGVQRRWEVRRERRRARLEAAADAEEEPELAGTTGDYVGLCMLVQFPDVPATILQGEVDNFCNQPGYTGFGNNGSAYDYFLAVSDGKLRYTNVVTAYYTSQHPRAHYTDPAIPYGTRARELIIEALDSLVAGGFDFSVLSSDSGNFVYALSVFYAGPRVNNWSEGLWPHSWALATPYNASPTKQFSDYQITDMGTQLTLRTFCHENGHMVCDFPDLYDYGGEGNGVGHYCLMCFGGSNTNPTQVDAYLKHIAGWTSKSTILTPAMTAVVAAGSNDFLIHKRNATEYFIMENRQQSGRDTALPDAGLAIWHVDELGSNNNEQMTPSQHYECSLEQADKRFDLEKMVNAGDVEDLYGGPTAVSFGDGTTPNSKWWDGSGSGLEIEQVSMPGPSMTVKTKGGVSDMSSVVGTWAVVAVDWGCTGSVLKAGPFTFNADGSWTYSFGGGRWIQVGGIVAWNFTNAAGLIYAANISANAMSGIMGYATSGSTLKGCFYALRSPSPAASAEIASALASLLGTAQESDSDAVVGPAEGADSEGDAAVGEP